MVFARSQARTSAVCKISMHLHKIDALSLDATIDILTGLTKATNNDFTHPLKLLKDLCNKTIIDLGHLKSNDPWTYQDSFFLSPWFVCCPCCEQHFEDQNDPYFYQWDHLLELRQVWTWPLFLPWSPSPRSYCQGEGLLPQEQEASHQQTRQLQRRWFWILAWQVWKASSLLKSLSWCCWQTLHLPSALLFKSIHSTQ